METYLAHAHATWTTTILITGGAGFIGSHLADELLVQATRPRARQTRAAGARDTARGRLSRSARSSWWSATSATAEAVGAPSKGSTRSSTSRRGSASARACTRSRDYTSVNNLGTAVLLEALIERPVERLVVASSMSIYGEGLYRDADGNSGARRRARPLSSSGPATGRSGTPGRRDADPAARRRRPRRPSLASVYALSKYDQERLCLMVGRAYDIPTVALRFFNVYGTAPGALEPVHRGARHLRLAPAERQAAAHLRGRPAAARFRQRLRRRPRLPAGARGAGARRATCSTSAAARPSRCARSPRGIARGARPRATSQPEVTGKLPRRRHPPLLRRHLAGRASVLGYEPRVALRARG